MEKYLSQIKWPMSIWQEINFINKPLKHAILTRQNESIYI